jgi:transposase
MLYKKTKNKLPPVGDKPLVWTTINSENELVEYTLYGKEASFNRPDYCLECKDKDREILKLVIENIVLRDRLSQNEIHADNQNCSTLSDIPCPKCEELQKENAALRAETQKIREQLALMKGSRDSRTSSTPPSQDLGRSNSNSLRTPSDKKSGGQPGHAGHTLQMSDTPNDIINHVPEVCTCCGHHLEEVPIESYTRRQLVDIPPVQPEYIEHRSHVKTCPQCGKKNKGVFPDRITAPVQYGPVIESTAVYMSVYQYSSYNRIVDFFKACFKLPLSEGCVYGFLESMSNKAIPAYDRIRQQIHVAPVVGGDETSCKVNGMNFWFHVWQNLLLTFIVVFPRRSHEVVETYFSGGFINSVYVSDCNASQLKTPAKAHQLCIVHLLRELLNFEKNLGCQWSIQMKELFYDAMELKRSMTPDDYLNPSKQVTDIHNRLDKLLEVDYSKFNKKEKAFIKRLIKYRDSIFTFLAYDFVPSHNNGSESAIRNVKVKTKVSGQFRNAKGKGAGQYAKIRSVVDTSIKNGQDVYTALLNLAKC